MWQFTPYALMYGVALCGCLAVVFAAYRMQPVRGALMLSLAALGMAIWIIGYMLGFFHTDLGWKIVALRIEYLGIVASPCLLFLFVLRYTQLDLPKTWLGVCFVAFPAVFLLAVLSFPWHQLLYVNFGTRTLDSGFVVFTKSYGPLFYLWMSYSYALMVGSGLLLAFGARRMPRRYQPQVLVMGVVVATILVANVAFVTGYNPIAPHDPTPLTFAVAALLTYLNMRRFRFLDIVPVAHNMVFEQVSAGVAILNERGNIIDLNDSAASIFGISREQALGRGAGDFLPFLRDAADEFPSRQELSISDRFYDINITPMSRSGHSGGHVILMYDETQRKEMQEKQEHLITELRAALSEVQVLKGMVPICASCKNIRDDAGYWHELEAYMHKHSDMSFSHGICPACFVKLYPDLPQAPLSNS